MPIRPPLTREQLHEIGQRRAADDCIALLWEIKRLRALVLRADQLQRSLGSLGGGPGIVLAALRDELAGEPVVAEIEATISFGIVDRLKMAPARL